MNKDLFQIGMKVNIEVEGQEENSFFPSKIEDVEPEKLVLSMPMKKNMIYFIAINKPIKIYFLKGDFLYCVDGKVINKTYSPVPLLTAQLVGQPYKNQRREYFRLKISLDVSAKVAGSEHCVNGRTRDLSAGGALLLLPEEIKKGEVIEVRLSINSEDLVLKALVVRSEKDLERRVNPYNVAVQFMEIDNNQRDFIIKFLLSEQRRLRKKGLI
ncbi:flagellar brake protein [Thermoanaerobacterium sp. DL9XJH110]|uniref:flagellar brake protein n=1 Tax=Thermoanaerobacterium sp. DL9XJH110 TaxID=3386643 RepID=UPI003BB7801A